MCKVYKDHPINNATHFNFDIYANSLAKIIRYKENETPFTIAINGKWGSGKTTLMKTLRNKLDIEFQDAATREVKTVWFNAWKYSECDSMLASLVNEILEEMERQNLLDKLKARILIGSEKVDLLKQMSDLAKMLTLGHGPEFEKWFRKTDYQNKLSFFDLFQDYMKTILKTFVLEKENGEYTDCGGVLVIFIDDLDRCSPKTIANILESINLFLDLEGCFFVIGTDISVISNAIDYQYQGIANFSGIDYIKKMIQLNFDLPMLKEDDIKKFMNSELKIDKKLEKYFDIIVKGLKSNQREIIRFLNSVNLMRILGKPLQGSRYDEELLIKWSILNFSSSDFIEEVKRNQNLLIEIQEIAKIKTEADRKNYMQNLESAQLLQKCQDFSENDQIISVLSLGAKNFTLENIDACLFLSNIVPKDIPVGKLPFKDEIEFSPGVDLTGTDLTSFKMIGVNLLQANLNEAILNEVNLTGTILMQANLIHACMRKANLSEANLWEANLEGANLEGAILERANLKGANLEGANLIGANFKGAILEGANLEKANLNGARFNGANLEGAKFDKAHLIGANFEEVRLVATSLKDANLDRAEFVKSNLEGANLKRANLKQANFEEASLKGAILIDANLEGANLDIANLKDAKLMRANFKGAILEGASFGGAILIGASFEGARLVGANLEETNLERTNLKGANFEGANLERANLERANFEGAKLEETRLVGANLMQANLEEANLMQANLEGTNLKEASFIKANFEGVNLERANLMAANLTGARNLTIEQLCKVKTLYNVNLEKKLQIPLKENYPALFDVP